MAKEDWDFLQVSRNTEPCKICGKNDFCFRRRHLVDGNVEHCCHRATSQSDIVGIDGLTYLWKREMTPTTGVVEVFETEEDRQIRNGSSRAPRPTTASFERNIEPLKGAVEVAVPDELDSFNRSLIKVMSLSKKHEALLRKDWNSPNTPNLFERIMSVYPVLSCPPSDYIVTRYGYKGDKSLPRRKDIAGKMSAAGYDITKQPGFVINNKGEADIISSEGMWFPVYNKDGKHITWRVRCDYPDIKGVSPDGREGVFSHTYNKSGEETVRFYPTEQANAPKEEYVNVLWPPKGKTQNKYKNLTGVFEKRDNGERCNGYGNGSRIGSCLSLYTQPNDNMSVVFLVEGEKKAMVANILSGYPCVSIPGVSSFMKLFQKEADGESMMDSLIRRGCRLAVVCYDADKANNKNVLSAQNGLTKSLSEAHIQVAIGEWNENWGKGLDDIYVNGLKPTIYPVKL